MSTPLLPWLMLPGILLVAGALLLRSDRPAPKPIDTAEAGKFSRFRDALDRNKVFFDTIMAISLTLAGLVVALETKTIYQQQTDLVKVGQLPALNVYLDPSIQGTPSGIPSIVDVLINNTRGPLHQLNMSSSLSIQLCGASGKRTECMYYPDSYPFYTEQSGAGVGQVGTFKSIDGLIDLFFAAAKTSIISLPADGSHGSYDSLHVELIITIELRYLDQFNQPHMECYQDTINTVQYEDNAYCSRIDSLSARWIAASAGFQPYLRSPYDFTKEMLLSIWDKRGNAVERSD